MLQSKLEKLDRILEQLLRSGGIAVAFSGGVDSTYVLWRANRIAHKTEEQLTAGRTDRTQLSEAEQRALRSKIIAITAVSPFVPQTELDFARVFCRNNGIGLAELPVDVLEDDEIVQNPPNRCYICKTLIFENAIQLAHSQGIENFVDGTNASDLSEDRPGIVALRELGIKSPLAEAGLTKDEIRQLSREAELITWDKPSMACLATRIPHGMRIERTTLEMIERSENLLHDLGFGQVRVRIHALGGSDRSDDLLARIELEHNGFFALSSVGLRKKVVHVLCSFGFKYVTVDLKSYGE